LLVTWVVYKQSRHIEPTLIKNNNNKISQILWEDNRTVMLLCFVLVVQLLGWANPRTKLSFIQGKQKELNRVPLRFGLLLIPFTHGLC